LIRQFQFIIYFAFPLPSPSSFTKHIIKFRIYMYISLTYKTLHKMHKSRMLCRKWLLMSVRKLTYLSPDQQHKKTTATNISTNEDVGQKSIQFQQWEEHQNWKILDCVLNTPYIFHIVNLFKTNLSKGITVGCLISILGYIL